MSTSEEVLIANSDSFWEVDCYKRTVKRVEDGLSSCNDLMKMVQERADIEKEYAKRLKIWSKRWNEYLDKSSEYGSTKTTLKESLDESEKLADVHLTIRDRLTNEIQHDIKEWRNDNYKKNMVGGCREAKSFDEDFKRAQKPWSKKLSKVLKSKKDYHNACKQERTAVNQETNAKNNAEISLDQLRKYQEKVDKCKKDVIITKEKYEQALIELNAYNGRYIEDMAEVYQKTQDFERGRLNFIKGMLYKMQSCLDLTKFTEIPIIYNNYVQSVQKIDPNRDLKWWSENHGVDMPMAWPVFEEYITEFHNITTKPTKSADGGVMLTYVQKSEPHSNLPASNVPNTATTASTATTNNNNNVTTSNNAYYNGPQPQQARQTFPSQSNNGGSPNGRGLLNSIPEDEPDTVTSTTAMNRNSKLPTVSDMSNNNIMKNGVKVKALYAYEGQEKDELSFKAGEIFMKLKDRDEQGWCTGFKDGRVGLYPDNYVELITDTSF